jgi:branched-subunit amino acid transport protein
MTTTGIWIVIGVSSTAMLLMRLFGYLLPPEMISRPRILRITALIPVVLLAALVSVQTLTVNGSITLDHRAAGLVAGAIALYFKRSFLTVMASAGLVGAMVYNFL